MFSPFRPSATLATEAAGVPGASYAARPSGLSAVAFGGAPAGASPRGSYAGPSVASGPTALAAGGSRGRVVLAGGDAAQAFLLRRTLEADGFGVVPVGTGRETVVSLIEEPADVLLVNAPLTDGSAAALVRWVRARPVSAAMACVVICPGHDTATVARLYDAGADIVITRQTELDLLSRKVAAALARRPLAMAS